MGTMVHSGYHSMTKFIYVPNMSMKSSDAPDSEKIQGTNIELIYQHQESNFREVTGGQGEVDWYIICSGSGCVTSTISHALLVPAQENICFLDCICIRRIDADAGYHIPINLNSLTTVQL